MNQFDKKNLIIFALASFLILYGFHHFFEKPKLEKMAEEAKQTEQVTEQEETKESSPLPETAKIAMVPALKQEKTITVDNDKVKGTLSSKGFRIADLTLKDYRETTDPTSDNVQLLMPSGEDKAFYAEFGWVAPDQNTKTPDNSSYWSTKDTQLTSSDPVEMVWDNGEGVQFKRTIEMDDKYMFTIRQTVENNSAKTIEVRPYGLVSRHNPETMGYMVLHEGPVGYLDDKLREIKYEDLDKDGKQAYTTKSGWLGITDKYWLAALVPDQKVNVKASYKAVDSREGKIYQADYIEPVAKVEPGRSMTTTSRFFAGAKSLQLLDDYENINDIPHFDLAIDFGWFYFITKPLFFAIKWLYDLLGNFGLAIIALTILVRLSFFPLASQSFKSMARMRELQPEMERLKKLYGDDKAKLQQETMEIYKKNKINPVSGCVPMLIQIPVFFALYKVLFVTIEMRHAPFFGWLQDLSEPDPTSLFNLFGLIPWDPPSMLQIGVLPILMGISMYFQQKLNPQPQDPIQAKVFAFLPLIFTYMLAHFPAGLVLYWICSNLFSIFQQMAVKKQPKKARK
jgi:YidC/Oxa1 family membrane protein insertase